MIELNQWWEIVLVLYALIVFAIALTKPPMVMKTAKIKVFIKMFKGERNTIIFFYVFGLIVLLFGLFGEVWFT
jgi:hypothetical protein